MSDDELAAIRERAAEFIDWIAVKAERDPSDVSITEDHYVEVVPVLLAEIDRLRLARAKMEESMQKMNGTWEGEPFIGQLVPNPAFYPTKS